MRLASKIKSFFTNRVLFNRRRCVVDVGTMIHPCASIVNLVRSRLAIKIGSYSHVKAEILTMAHGGEITIGDYCYIGEGTKIWSGVKVAIGNRVLIAHNVNIFDNDTHPIDPKQRHEQFKNIITSGHPTSINLFDEPITICDDVWIGAMVTVLKGVCIGKGAIVGAGSIVVDDVPEYTIVVGNPARIVRKIPKGKG